MDIEILTQINIGLVFGILFLVVMISLAWIFKKFFIARGTSALKILAVFGILFLTTSVIVGMSITSLSVENSSKERANELNDKLTKNNNLIETIQQYILELKSNNTNKDIIENLRDAIKELGEENEDLEDEINDLEDEINDLWGMMPSGY
jgi:cell division protein FtsB